MLNSVFIYIYKYDINYMVQTNRSTHQSSLQHVQLSGRLSQQQLQLVPDDVDLLLGLQAVVSGGLQEELSRDLLQGGHLALAAAQFLLQVLQPGGDTAEGSILRVQYEDETKTESSIQTEQRFNFREK